MNSEVGQLGHLLSDLSYLRTVKQTFKLPSVLPVSSATQGWSTLVMVVALWQHRKQWKLDQQKWRQMLGWGSNPKSCWYVGFWWTTIFKYFFCWFAVNLDEHIVICWWICKDICYQIFHCHSLWTSCLILVVLPPDPLVLMPLQVSL